MTDASSGSTPMLATDVDAAWLRGLPKAEVHLHLEGCIPVDVVIACAERAGAPAPPALTPSGPVLPDLDALLGYLDWSCALLDHADDLTVVAYETAVRASASGVGHIDAIVNPTHWPAWRGRLPEMLGAFDRGFARAESEGHATAGLCVSLKRSQSEREALDLVAELADLGHRRVVALSLDGNERAAGRTGRRFAPAFAAAERCGLHRCVHAGESSGPEGVWDAIDLLGAERIDHGVRSIEDERLVRTLAARAIPLGVCPTSNVRLGIVESLSDHPLGRLLSQGVRLSLNTDDPLLFGIDVVNEYASTAAAFEWDRQTAAAIARTSIESCFASDARRKALLGAHDAYVRSGGDSG